ncbi:MAG: hypothetical protein ACQERU_13600, partial [Bacteroidota bacterium]
GQHKRYIDKDTKFQDQLRIVYKSFFQYPQTMKEVDVTTGIMRENVCRYVATLRQQNRIFPIRERKCRITNHIATEWTANPALVPENPQLSFNF